MSTLIRSYPQHSEGGAPTEGKFLQLRLAGRDCLLFAAASECRYHNQILARFLSEQGISHRWEGAANLVAEHSALALTGGGRYRLDPTGKTLHVWDDSSVYGRFDPSQMAAQLAAAAPPWNELRFSAG